MRSSQASLWPYGIIATFIVFIGGLASYVTFACSHDVELVATDYYQREIEYETQMERIRRAQSLGDEVNVRYQEETLILSLPKPTDADELSGEIQFYCPANASLDRHFPLDLDSQGRQHFSDLQLVPGLWRMKVTWKALEEEYHFEQPLFVSPGHMDTL